MTILKNILTIIMTVISIVTYSQTDTTIDKYKYKYEVCIHNKPEGKSTVYENVIIGLLDTETVLLGGVIFDNKRQPISNATLELISLTNNQNFITHSDSLGNFTLELPSDKYQLTVHTLYSLYSRLTIRKIKFSSREYRELKIQLGTVAIDEIHLVQSVTPLTKIELKRFKSKMKKHTNADNNNN